MSDILSKILATKVEEVTDRSRRCPLSALRQRCETIAPPRGFIDAIVAQLAQDKPAIISEIKKASPSKGIIRHHFDVVEIAKSYAKYGATCLSVLTDEKYFQGHNAYLEQAQSACPLPLLRKEFIIDRYQVYESRACGADAILLIVAALDDATIMELAMLSHELGMDVLIEIHDQQELERALVLPCKLIGINNRNLHTFETSLNTTIDLLAQIPDNRIVVTESGIHTPADVMLMRKHKVNTFLVGEAFMRAEQPGQKLQHLFSKPYLTNSDSIP